MLVFPSVVAYQNTLAIIMYMVYVMKHTADCMVQVVAHFLIGGFLELSCEHCLSEVVAG